jgi:hypothetical protein
MIRRLTQPWELERFRAEHNLRHDWHEPDEPWITARLEGTPLDFDNAGFWPLSEETGYGNELRAELHVIFSRCHIENGVKVRDEDLACVNLADLCSWASAWGSELESTDGNGC